MQPVQNVLKNQLRRERNKASYAVGKRLCIFGTSLRFAVARDHAFFEPLCIITFSPIWLKIAVAIVSGENLVTNVKTQIEIH